MKIRTPNAQHFKEFLCRPTLLEFLVAVSLGSVFTPMVTSLATEIMIPIIASWTDRSAVDLFWVVAKGKEGAEYSSAADARADGAVVIGYGKFLQAIFVFMVQALAVYTIVSLIR